MLALFLAYSQIVLACKCHHYVQYSCQCLERKITLVSDPGRDMVVLSGKGLFPLEFCAWKI